MTWSKAFICGCGGLELTSEEREFLRNERPWGLILFRRNISQPIQVKKLISDFRDCVGNGEAPVLVDQEGGRVQRFGPPHWPVYPPAAAFSKIEGQASDRRRASFLAARLLAHDLRTLGVTVDCMPVLDVPEAGAHQVIGDRAYSKDPEEVASLGGAACEGLLDGGVVPVIKHIPGHGRARADSHLELPVVRASAAELRETDFAPFKALRHAPAAMTAHVVYASLDPERPATLSPLVVKDVMRGEIGFRGLLMTDDLSMKALSGSFRERAQLALQAGVDLVLHCNGDLREASEVAAACPRLEGDAHLRAEAALAATRREPGPIDLVDARARLDSMLASGKQ